MTALASPLGHMPNDLAAVADPLRTLALAARDGESIAFTQLYERTREQAWRVLYRVVGIIAVLVVTIVLIVVVVAAVCQ